MFNQLIIPHYSDNETKYLAIPSIENPRLIISLLNYKLYKNGLAFHNTASIKNRIIKKGLEILYVFHTMYKKNICTYTNQIKELLESLEKYLNKKLYISAFYIGTTNNENQKITIQLCNIDFNPIGILKIPLSSNGSCYIENEHNTLKKLNVIQFENLLIPRNFFWVNSNSINALFEEDIFSRLDGIPLKLSDEVLNVSLELSKIQIQKELDSYLSEITNAINEINLPEEIDKLFEDSKKIIFENKVPLIFIHGDFVKYNMKSYGKKIALIDWEFTREGLPLFDLFHFIFQGYSQIKKYKINKVIKRVFSNYNLRQYSKYLNQLSISSDLIKPLFILYLIDSLVFERKLKPTLELSQSNYYKALKLLEIG